MPNWKSLSLHSLLNTVLKVCGLNVEAEASGAHGTEGAGPEAWLGDRPLPFHV